MAMGVGRGGRGCRKKHARMSEINVTPMVDVMLVLLIIFMVTAPMITSGINIDLPETNASPSRSDVKPLEITIDKSGNIYVASEKVDTNEFPAKLKAIHDTAPDRLVYLRGDRHLNYGRFAEVMGDVSAAGFTKITILTGVKS